MEILDTESKGSLNKQIFLLLIISLVLIIFIILKFFQKNSHKKDPWKYFPQRFPQDVKSSCKTIEERDYYDVTVVGAGPGGATTAFYLAKLERKVLLLEKKKFPRDKYCGDAVCKTAIEILMEMGVYQKLVEENKLRVADHGGMVSPGGLSYIGRSHEILGEIPAAVACKRIHLDNAIAMAAKAIGADLKEEHPVSEAKFDTTTALWTIYTENGAQFKSRVLVCADGAPSKLATQLGIVKRPTDGACSRSYVEPGTHRFKADGVIFYNKKLLPGEIFAKNIPFQ